MRWTIIFLLCAGASTAKYLNNERLGGMLKRTIAHLEDDLENTRFPDTWSDDEDFMTDDEDDDDVYPVHNKKQPYQQRHHKQGYLEDSDEDLSLSSPQDRRHKQQTKQSTHHQPQCKRDGTDCYDQQHKQQRHQQHLTGNDDYDEEEYAFDDNSEDERVELPQQQRRQQEKQKKRHHQHQQDDDEEDEQYHQQHQQRKQQHHGQQKQPQQECKPNYQLLQNLEQANARLAAKLHKEAKEGSDDKNTVVSPVAVQLALVAMKQGARGETKRQISRLTGAGLPKNQEDNAHAALIRSLQGKHGGQDHQQVGGSSKTVATTIKSTTCIVLSQQSAQERFVQSVKNCFDGEVKRCDFRNQPHECRDQINLFVTGKTELKLHKPLARNSITANTKMISIGTMQVKANWPKELRKFQKMVDGRFYPLGEEQPINVKMLQSEGDFNYYEDDQMRMVGLPTQDQLVTLYVALPNERHGLNKLEKQRLQYGKQLLQVLDQCDSTKQTLRVHLPLFQTVFKFDTKHVLRSLGVDKAFDADESDFGDIVDEEKAAEEHVLKYDQRKTGGLEDVGGGSAKRSRKQHLHFNKFIQQATIQINENGIDAASGIFQAKPQKQSKTTPAQEESKHTDQSQYQFQADHAFVFMVKHNPSNQLLLIGRVVDASEQNEQEQE